jgi:hypothetical protein
LPLFVRRNPFLLLGLLTLSLFLGVEALTRTGHADTAAAVAGPVRVLIVPMYVVWMPFTILNAGVVEPDASTGELVRLIWISGLVAGLAPYLLADYLLARRRRARGHRVAAT